MGFIQKTKGSQSYWQFCMLYSGVLSLKSNSTKTVEHSKLNYAGQVRHGLKFICITFSLTNCFWSLFITYLSSVFINKNFHAERNIQCLLSVFIDLKTFVYSQLDKTWRHYFPFMSCFYPFHLLLCFNLTCHSWEWFCFANLGHHDMYLVQPLSKSTLAHLLAIDIGSLHYVTFVPNICRKDYEFYSLLAGLLDIA